MIFLRGAVPKFESHDVDLQLRRSSAHLKPRNYYVCITRILLLATSHFPSRSHGFVNSFLSYTIPPNSPISAPDVRFWGSWWRCHEFQAYSSRTRLVPSRPRCRVQIHHLLVSALSEKTKSSREEQRRVQAASERIPGMSHGEGPYGERRMVESWAEF